LTASRDGDTVADREKGSLKFLYAPTAIVKLLNERIRNILQADDVKAKFRAQGLQAAGSTPAAFRSFVEAQVVQWGRVIKDVNIRIN